MTKYFCDRCGEECSELFEASIPNERGIKEELCPKCYEEDKICPCKSGKRMEGYYHYEVVGYGKSEWIYVDYRFPAIVKLRRYDEPDHNYVYDKDKIPIQYCPFCGRKLKGDAE